MLLDMLVAKVLNARHEVYVGKVKNKICRYFYSVNPKTGLYSFWVYSNRRLVCNEANLSKLNAQFKYLLISGLNN